MDDFTASGGPHDPRSRRPGPHRRANEPSQVIRRDPNYRPAWPPNPPTPPRTPPPPRQPPP
ncbi:LytR family transcriptional regulator, partial [Mycolicibacterium peregrinum]